MIKRSEKGSITLFTLIAMMFLLTIAFTAYASAMIKLQAQNEELERIKASYEQDLTEEGLRELYNKLTGTREWLQGEGTEQNPYKIYKIEDLVEFSNRTNRAVNADNFERKYVELMNDIDFNDVRSYEKFDRTDFGDVNDNGAVEPLRTELTSGKGFSCISTNAPFEGTFLGGNNYIKNLYIKNETSNLNIGLFSKIGNCTIQDLEVTGNLFTSVDSNIGGIVGCKIANTNCLIKNCSSKCNIKNMGQLNVGGIVGNTETGTIEIINCHNEGILEGGSRTGGIAGFSNTNMKLENCYNTGEIKNSINNSSIGGLLGYDNYKTIRIEDSYNEADITGTEKVGGIIGFSGGSLEISNTYNKGVIQGINHIGGIVGNSFGNNNISNTHNEGNIISTIENVSSNIKVGGILGWNNIGTVNITNCYNNAEVKSNATNTSKTICVSGIAGHIKIGIIEKCYNTGKIMNGNRTAGILGEASGGANSLANVKIIDCYNTGMVDATTLTHENSPGTGGMEGRAGGIVFITYYANLNIINCYNTGEIKATYSRAGILAQNGTGSNNTNIINCYNIGSVNGRYAVVEQGMNGSVLSVSNTYYLDNVSKGVRPITPDPATKMTETQMKATSFVTTLNNNKNNINLSNYGLSDYTLSSWKTGSDGYPTFDW